MREHVLSLRSLVGGALIVWLVGAGCSARQKMEKSPGSDVSRNDQGSETGSAPESPSETDRLNELVDIHFDFDRYDLRPSDRAILSDHAKWLLANLKMRVLIEGHCDERGTVEYNLALGERRARAARDYLVNSGIAQDRLDVISYGKERPLDPHHNEVAWALNRRAHFMKR